MPYTRSGKCVYKQRSDGSRGKKKGCSDTGEKAKKYMKRLYSLEEVDLDENMLREFIQAQLNETQFAPTAQEEAERINTQAGSNEYGMSLVTDQSFWEEQGIYTGEELAMSMLKSSYSDLYKSVHGIRPNLRRFETIDHINAALHDLDRYANEVLAREKADAAEWEAYEKERKELEALMPTELELKYDPMPQYSGMGRRAESHVIKTLGALIREYITAPDIDAGAKSASESQRTELLELLQDWDTEEVQEVTTFLDITIGALRNPKKPPKHDRYFTEEDVDEVVVALRAAGAKDEARALEKMQFQDYGI